MDDFGKRFFNRSIIAYWIALAIVILGEQRTFGHWWKRRESHRWTMGYFTVFSLAFPLVIRGRWDLATFAGLFVGVGIAGAIKTGTEALEASWEAERLRQGGFTYVENRRGE